MIRMRINILLIVVLIIVDVGRKEDLDVDIWFCLFGIEEIVDWLVKKKILKYVNEIWNFYYYLIGIWFGINMVIEES